ncbi:MAG: hypothetical protein AAB403_20100, partial [Planctomycetota bacterium]
MSAVRKLMPITVAEHARDRFMDSRKLQARRQTDEFLGDLLWPHEIWKLNPHRTTPAALREGV